MVLAAAEIIAPIAYIKVVAVKKLEVGLLVEEIVPTLRWVLVSSPAILGKSLSIIKLSGRGSPLFTVKKIDFSKQAYAVEYISM